MTKMNNLKSLFAIALVSVSMASSAQKEVESSLSVSKVGNIINIDGHQVFYSLPQNSLVVSIDITKTVYAQGPYAQYAQKYLNITTGIVDETKTEYQIDGLSVDRFSSPDTSQLYAINYSGIDYLPMVQLNADGSILAINSKNGAKGYKLEKIQSGTEPVTEPISFVDFGVKPFFLDEIEETAEDDSISAKKPKQPTTVVKTVEENAADAAAVIRKIRKRRLKLVAGISGEANAVDGKAMKSMIKELDKLEAEYLSLFIGKKVQVSYKQSVSVTPNADSNVEQITVGYFSKSQGFAAKQDAKRTDCYPVTMKITTLTSSPKVSIKEVETSAKTTSSIKYGVYYRMPATVSISVDCDGLAHYSKMLVIAQKGVVVPLPTDYMNNQKFAIEFDAETGALKSISNN